MAQKNILKVTVLAAALALAGCGGSGGGYYGSSDSSGSGSTTEGVTAVNITNISLNDTNGVSTRTVSATGATATVTVTDESGDAISGALVTFSSTGGVEFGTSNGAVLTNADGEATVSVKPADSTDTGSYQLSATVEYDGLSATTSAYNFSLQAQNITIANLTLGSTSLTSGGSTIVTLNTQNSSSENINNVAVNFTTSCGSFSSDSVTSSSNGDVATTYSAIDADGNLCAGSQTITATPSTSSSNAVSTSVTIAAIEANSILYTTTGTVNLGKKSSGSSTSGQIQFTVYANGVPAANKSVKLELAESSPADFSFVSPGNRSSQTITSNSSGIVAVSLYPGNIPGPVEVKASLVSNSNVSATSKNVVVSTGRAAQNGFSLSASKYSLQNNVDGDTATITARLTDRNGNPIPDDTVVSFVAEGGSITPSCQTSGGSCSVTLSTQNPRPTNNRVTVLAYLEGDKSYTDTDGDNVYTVDKDTLLNNIGSFFRDDNEDNIYTEGEFRYDRSITGANTACAASTYNQPNIKGTCDNQLSTVLRQQLTFAFAENTATFTDVQLKDDVISFYVYGNSALEVPMPTGSSVSVTAYDNTDYYSVDERNCSATLTNGSASVPKGFDLSRVYGTGDTYVNGFKGSSSVYYTYFVNSCKVGDVFKISVTAPDGKVSSTVINYQ